MHEYCKLHILNVFESYRFYRNRFMDIFRPKGYDVAWSLDKCCAKILIGFVS